MTMKHHIDRIQYNCTSTPSTPENLTEGMGIRSTCMIHEAPDGTLLYIKTCRCSKDRFLNEVRLQMLASEVGLAPRVIEADACSKTITMQYIEGSLLSEHMGCAAADVQDAIQTMLDKVRCLHGAGILHMDLHCNNVIVPPSGLKDAMLIDFGESRDIGGAKSQKWQERYGHFDTHRITRAMLSCWRLQNLQQHHQGECSMPPGTPWGLI